MAVDFGSASYPPLPLKHDVYLSFRGEDTRHNFTDHLYDALTRRGCKAFIDDNLTMGEEIAPSMLRAIEESKAFIIVFSQNYASSSWCLDELTKIMECSEERPRVSVFPVFYNVGPSDVRNQRGSFGEAFAMHERRFGDDYHDLVKVQRWREALRRAADLTGWSYSSSDGSESKLIRQIVEHVSLKVLDLKVLDPIHLAGPKYPVGIGSRERDVAELVLSGGSDVRMIGIWGTGGIGKTTIAKAVYNSIVHKFESSCFLQNLRERSTSYEGLVKLQNVLLSQVLRDEDVNVTSVDQGSNVIQGRLRWRNVLLVLDDVNQLNQLETLAGGSHWFGVGSRVIITTRDKHLLNANQVECIYKVEKLDNDEAFELFSWHAFHTKTPLTDYMELTSCIVQYTQGLPLALEIFGSGLYGRPIQQWQEAKDSNWNFFYRPLHEKLKISYDALDESVKQVFLDIACFFTGQNKNYVVQILAGGGLNPENSISVLQEKAFINVNDENHILMDNLLVQMGKEIVQNESPDESSKRSRLWSSDDVYDVLTEGTGTDQIKGIMVKLSEPDEIVLNATSFSGMKNLKYFINQNGSFTGSIDYLPDKLQLIDWPEFPFESLPSNFSPKKLVKLNMPRSRIKRIGERFKRSRSLRYINLESSSLLKEIPDLSGFPNLKGLNLNNCSSLGGVHDSVGVLDKLVALSLSGCSNLTVFPRSIALKSVEYISLRGCTMLKTFSEIVPKMESLTSLDLSCTGIEKLPSSITYLINLEELTVRACENLRDLSDSIFKLPHLWSLDLQDCSKLAFFPKWSAESLSAETPDLCYLNLRGCKMLQEIPELPPKINWVNAADCTFLERFAKLSNIMKGKESEMIKCITLLNCQRLCKSLAQGVTGTEHILVDEICSAFLSCVQSEFNVVFPGNAVPRWFDHREDLNKLVDTSEFSFQIPRNFKPGNKGLAICAAAATVKEIDSKEKNLAQNNCFFTVRIDIDAESIVTHSFKFEAKDMKSAHVWLLYIPFIKFAHRLSPPFFCRVRLGHSSQGSVSCKSYGVHLVVPETEYEDEDEDEDDGIMED